MATFGTWSSGDILTAADLNTVLPACALPLTSVSVPSASSAWVAFAAESHDPLGWHDNSTNNSRITPTIAGWYLCSAYLNSLGTGNARQIFTIWRNRSEVVDRFDISNYAPDDVGVTGMVYMNGTTDYVEAEVVQFSGFTLTGSVKFAAVLVAR